MFLATPIYQLLKLTPTMPTTPPLDFDHQLGDEIPIKHKEAIHQLYSFAKIPIKDLMARYKLSKSTICRILNYD